MKHRVLLFVPAVLILSVAAACGSDETSKTATPEPQPSAPGPSATAGRSLITIQVDDNTFAPANLTVPMGTKVTWDWDGKNPHSVAGSWQGNTIQSPQFSRTGSFEFTFDTAGTFSYQCGVHGAAMAGKVTVKP